MNYTDTLMPNFKEEKTVEAVAYLLEKFGSNKRVEFMTLLKLLVIADRKSLEQWERPITYDQFFSMKMGQVLTNTYNLMKRDWTSEIWDEHFSHEEYYYLRLQKPLKPKKLSPAEVGILDETFEEYGNISKYDLGKITHDLPEYEDPGESSTHTPLNKVLDALGFSSEDVERITLELNEEATIDEVFES